MTDQEKPKLPEITPTGRILAVDETSQPVMRIRDRRHSAMIAAALLAPFAASEAEAKRRSLEEDERFNAIINGKKPEPKPKNEPQPYDLWRNPVAKKPVRGGGGDKEGSQAAQRRLRQQERLAAKQRDT